MNSKIILILVVNYLLCEVLGEERKIRIIKEQENADNTFIPTYEWQVVKKGQTIPKGLHVRINLETGLTEAKLLDPTEKNKNNALLTVPEANKKEINHNADRNNGKEKTISSADLKQFLKNMKAEDVSNVQVQGNFKSYEKLKEELEDLNLSVKSDAEILRDLFKQLKDIYSDTNLEANEKNMKVLSVLQNLEYLVHQIDNANEFVNLNGFVDIVYINLNNTNVKVKCESLNILGSCVQNNAKAQIHGFETGAIDKLLKVLALDNDVHVKMRAIYALSNLLRRFPIAQKNFIKNGGLNIFTSNFEQSVDVKLHMKIITLIYDLLMEDKEAHDYVENIDYEERVRQYESVNLKNKLNELGWCKLFSKYFIDNFSLEKNDHDLLERYLNVMLLVTDICRSTFQDRILKTVLEELYQNYAFLSAQEEKENIGNTYSSEHNLYFTNLKSLVYKLLQIYKQDKIEL